MIGYSVHGCPRPVGSTFRQRTIYAEAGGRGEHSLDWVVSVAEARGGTAIEARTHLGPQAIVATDLRQVREGYVVQDVLKKAAGLLDSDGWAEQTVQPCEVAGCDRPLPMWKHGRRRPGEHRECLACSARTVLACVECGMPNGAGYNAATRERLLAERLCFTCDLWRQRLADGVEVLAQDWRALAIRRSGRSSPASCKGFGGREWAIRFDDGRVVETDDLWYVGVVPEWFRDRFTPNAEVYGKASPEGQALLAEMQS